MNVPAWVQYWAAVLGLLTVALSLIGAGLHGLYKLFLFWKKWCQIPEQIEELQEWREEVEEGRCRNSTPRRPRK